MPTQTLPIKEVIDSIAVNEKAIQDGKRRIEAVLNNQKPDSLPIIFAAPSNHSFTRNIDFIKHDEQEQMLYDQLVNLIDIAHAGSDAQLSVRADTGTGTLATIMGCKLLLCKEALPWTTHITEEEVINFDVNQDFSQLGVMPRLKELYEYFQSLLPDFIHLYCADTQSPFDLAQILIGNEFFYTVHDNPEFTHLTIQKATRIYIEGTTIIKRWIGEPLDSGYHGALSLSNGGVRCCEDSSTLLNPDMINEYVAPYQEEALKAFGGGWVHFCGGNKALLQAVIDNPYGRAVNFGNPKMYDFNEVIPSLISAGKSYYGTICRNDDETLKDYFNRVIGTTAGTGKGLIFSPTLKPDELEEPKMIVDLWRSLQ